MASIRLARCRERQRHRRTDAVERGVLICGTGIGMCIAANKVKGCRHERRLAEIGLIEEGDGGSQ